MNTFLYILLALILLIVVLMLIAPKKYEVSRSIVVNKPLAEVYNYLKYIKNQDSWSPWHERDPNMKKEYTGTDGEIGFVSAWDSDHKHVGAGEQEITGLKENEEIASQLRFLKPFKSVSDAYLRVSEENDGTKVTWGFYGDHKMPMNIMMLFMNMDKAVGKDFEQGLDKLKRVLEK